MSAKRIREVAKESGDDVLDPEPVFPIVGVGASAGGLAAFEEFLEGMPADTDPGMAFVLIQHLAPDHKSLLAELVRRYTRMEVFEVEDGHVVRPNCAYIIPPNSQMVIEHGRLRLSEPEQPRGLRLPIDVFFRSLAEEYAQKAIAVVLSGSGRDGTLGARAVKAAGGLVMAQSPDTAGFDGMPASVIEAGLADYILPPREMATRLMEYVSAANVTMPDAEAVVEMPEDEILQALSLLRGRTGHDFSQYKRSTVIRRIQRRMAVQRIEHLDEYVQYLRSDDAEIEMLFRDLLIGVTSLFRDQEAFGVLESEAIGPLLARKSPGDTVRVWVPGCSTGEEAYSIAILIQEAMERQKLGFEVKIFATDIDDVAIAHARTGMFDLAGMNDIGTERMSRFFTEASDGRSMRIHKSIRDMLLFSEQDVIKDPPFSHVDLISCRNLMIYLGAPLQARLIPMFAYAIDPGGYLFLGTSETVGAFGDLFTVVDRKAKLYQRATSPSDVRRTAYVSPSPIPIRPVAHRSRSANMSDVDVPRDLAEKLLLSRYAPASVLVNDRDEILYVHGRTGAYLEPAPGDAEMNILRMAREGLRRDLTIALRKAANSLDPIQVRNLPVTFNGDTYYVDMTVQAAGRPEAGSPRNYLVVFEEARRAPASEACADTPGTDVVAPKDEPEQVGRLRRELVAKEEYLQATLQEMETANEELKSTNEELQSVNEELQSTNEELETSKEELQSVNEELATVNSELQQKVTDLSQVNNDMNNLLAGTGVGTVFVDLDANIMRFTPAATKVINLIPTDVGRPVAHIVSNLIGHDGLAGDVRAVLDTLESREAEVQAADGAWYLLRIRPYRTLENVIEGATITFTDISEVKAARQALSDSESARRLAVVVRDSSDSIIVVGTDGHVLAWNPGATELYGWSEDEALGLSIQDLVPPESADELFSELRAMADGHVLTARVMPRVTKDGSRVDVMVISALLVDADGEPYALSLTERRDVFDEG